MTDRPSPTASDFLRWWSSQLARLLPAALGRRDPQASLVVEARDPAVRPLRVALTRHQGRRTRALGVFGLDPAGAGTIRAALRTRPATVALRVPSALLLERDVMLPLAAEAEPARVLEYEMDRLTPFTAGEVFWTCHVARRDRARSRLHLRLSLITRAALRELLAGLEQAGIVPTWIEAVLPDGAVRRIDLRARANAPGRAARVTRLSLGALCLALAAGAVAFPLVLQSRELARVDARIAELRPQVDAAEGLRRTLAARAAGTDVIAAERGRLGDPLAVLAAVTDLLPDDTFLTDLAMRGGKLTLNGQSAAAVRLIAALSADPVIRNPGFAAPVTRLQDGRADRFAIRAEVAP